MENCVGAKLFESLSERSKGQIIQLAKEVLESGKTDKYATIMGNRVWFDIGHFLQANNPEDHVLTSIKFCPMGQYPCEDHPDRTRGTITFQRTQQDIAYNLWEEIDVRVVIPHIRAQLDAEIARKTVELEKLNAAKSTSQDW